MPVGLFGRKKKLGKKSRVAVGCVARPVRGGLERPLTTPGAAADSDESRRRYRCIPQRQLFARVKPNCGVQTHGVSHDLPRRSPSGRRRAPPHHNLISLMQASRRAQQAYPRSHQAGLHTPTATFRPSQTTQRHRKPTGYHMTPPHLSHKSYKSYASVTPPQTAHRRCHKKALHPPAVNLHSEATQTAAQANPRGITWRPTIIL